MHIPTLLASLTATLTLAASLPSSPARPSQNVYVKTSHATHSRHNSLYLSTHHTGAGTADAVLTSNKTHAIKGVLNDTATTFEFDSTYAFFLITEKSANEWSPVTWSVGSPNPGFFINSTGLQWSTSTTPADDQFGAWRVCDWWYGVPQLFWAPKTFQAVSPGCSNVRLMTVKAPGVQ